MIQKSVRSADSAEGATKKWRYITGAFQIKIPVRTEEVLLGPEANTLAILKARLAAMSSVYRWYPVLKRYMTTSRRGWTDRAAMRTSFPRLCRACRRCESTIVIPSDTSTTQSMSASAPTRSRA